jgi:hypothetical protein
MASKKNDDDREKSFVVRDRRFSAQKEEDRTSQAKPVVKEEERTSQAEPEEKEEERTSQAEPEEKMEEAPPGETEQDQKTALPEISFANLIFSLSTSALIQLGEIKDPATRQAEKNFPLAKQTIDLIGLLQEKTKGNLTPEEAQLMEHVLYDLRMRYVKATG